MAEVETVKTAEELQAESDALKSAIAKKNTEIAAENVRLKQELAELNRISSKVPVCPACGSDTHEHCRPAAHNAGPSVAADTPNRG